MRSIYHRATVALFLLLPIVAISAQSQPLSHIAEIRNLSHQEAAKALPVHVRGVVTYRFWQKKTYFFIQDESGGICILEAEARRLQIWQGDDVNLAKVRVGMEVEIDGVSTVAGYAPAILPKTLKVLGKKALPSARLFMPARFFTGADNAELIAEVRGVVQGYQPSEGGWLLLLNANPGIISVKVSKSALKKPEALVDAEVCLRGVGGAAFNSRGELLGTRLLIGQPDEIVVENPAPRSPFDAPKVALTGLLPFSPEPLKPHRKLVEGTVIYVQPDGGFCLQDGDGVVWVYPLSQEPLKLGDRVQVAGFVDMQRQVADLMGAVTRKLGTASLPKAVSIDPSEILNLNTQAKKTGMPAQPHDFDGHLITFPGRLLNGQPVLEGNQSGYRLTMETGSTVVEILLWQSNPTAFNGLQPESRLQVTGIVQLEYSPRADERDYYFRPLTGVKVLLRSADDVAVLQGPSWWTPQRLLGLLVFGVVVFSGVLLWTWQLRRQLGRKSHELATEMHARRDAAIEFQAAFQERNRLAANIHDTLLQTISGLNYQLEACESESLPRAERKKNHLETARRMAQRAQEDLRDTVWALRVLPLHERTFAEALRTLANHLSEGRDVVITVAAADELAKLSEFVAGNLLLVAQEAMHNALKHARPSRIEVTVSAVPEGQQITLQVRDDGTGFDSETQPPPNSGHFGLDGMRERVERIDGKLWIESEPGHGTSVRAEVPLRPFDEELAGL